MFRERDTLISKMDEDEEKMEYKLEEVSHKLITGNRLTNFTKYKSK